MTFTLNEVKGNFRKCFVTSFISHLARKSEKGRKEEEEGVGREKCRVKAALPGCGKDGC